MKVSPISHSNIEHQVYKAISERIISGELEPGTRIVEEEIAASLGVSRTPVREAMKSLAKDELVTLLPRKGAYVRKLSREDLTEIYEIREVLEGLAVRLATKNIPNERIKKLTAQADEAKKELKKGNLEPFVAFDTALHDLVLEFCGNGSLKKSLDSLHNLIQYFRVSVAKYPGRASDAIDEHCRILAAMKARDSTAAENAMKDHIRISRERTVIELHLVSEGGKDET